MTRESRARWLAFVTAGVVVLLTALFSALRNLPAPPTASGSAPVTPIYSPRAQRAPAPAPAPDPVTAPAASPQGAARAPETTVAVNPARIDAGKRAYARLGCASCHSIAGSGRTSSPLDGVGSRLDRKALLEFTTGTGAAREELGAGLARRKARAVDDPDLDALVDYLAHLE